MVQNGLLIQIAEKIERTEATIAQLTNVQDFCRRMDVNPEKVMPAVEGVLRAAGPLREAAEAAGLNSRARKVVSDAIGHVLREGMS